MKLISLLIALVLVTTSYGQNDISQYTCSTDKHIMDYNYANANAVIGGIFSVHQKGTGGYGCGKPSAGAIRLVEAARFAIENLNQGNGYIPNVRFGIQIRDNCGSSTSALSSLQKLIPQSVSSNPYCTTQQKATLGIVSTAYSRVNRGLAKYASTLPVSIITPTAADPELSDKITYPTFLRTIPTRSMYAKAVAELLKNRKLEKVLLIYVDDTFGRIGYEELVKAMYQRKMCVSNALALSPNGDIASYRTALQGLGDSSFAGAILVAHSDQARLVLEAAQSVNALRTTQWILDELSLYESYSSLPQVQGSLMLLPRFPRMPEFENYLRNRLQSNVQTSDDPWLSEFETAMSCSFNNAGQTSCLPYFLQSENQDPRLVPMVLSIFAYAMAVRSVCPSGGFCSQLQTITPSDFHERLKNLDVTFDSTFPIASLRGQRIKFDVNGDPDVSAFTVYNYNNNGGPLAFREIGRYTSTGLLLEQEPSLKPGIGNASTALCTDVGCDNCLLPRRSVSLRYTPGDIVLASLITAHVPGSAPLSCGEAIPSRLAALVASEWAVSQYKTSNPNKLRGVTLGSLVADICQSGAIAQSFLTDLLSGNNRLHDENDNIISSTNIEAFVDDTGSYEARPITSILSKFHIPEIQVSASSHKIKKNAMNPYFARAVPSDEVYFTALSNLLNSMGWKYVQVATRGTGMCHQKSLYFQKVAARYGICVVGFVDFANGYNAALNSLVSNTESSVVVVIARKDDVRGLLQAIKDNNRGGSLQLIAGTEKWSTNPLWSQDLENAASGAITFGLQLSDNAAFSRYLQGLANRRSEIVRHPFLRELFEVTNGCSLDPSTRGMYERICTATDSFDGYQGETTYLIQSVFAVADKLDEIIKDLCGVNSNGLCSDFRAASDVPKRLADKLANMDSSVAGFGIKDGEGTTDIIFYRYNQGRYAQLIQFDTETQHLRGQLGPNEPGSFVSKCSGSCLECQYMFNLDQGLYKPGDWIIAGAFSASNSGPANFQPYQCGEIRTANGPLYSAAMWYALERVNSGNASVSVPGVTFGGLALDHCNNPGRMGLMVSEIYSGFFGNVDVHPNKILSWLTDNTASSQDAAQILDPLDVAMVSPSATSPSLMEFDNFYRTIQGDNTVAAALVKTIESLGARFIQVAYAANSYGQGGLATLKSVAEQEGLCVINQVALEDRSKAGDLVNALLSSSTEVVVFFMGTADTEAVLEAITQNQQARSTLLILMPEPYINTVARFGNAITRPIISLQLSSATLEHFNAYLASSPINNPYFAKYYMKMKNCNLDGYSKYPILCPTPLTPIDTDTGFNFALAVINAVYANVDALDLTIREYCNPDYTEPCPSFLRARDVRQRFNRNLDSVTFIDEGQNNFRFLEREGNTEYNILQYNKTQENSYAQMGSYGGAALILNEDVTAVYSDLKSECPSPCLECVLRGVTFSHIPGDVYLAGLFDIHKRGLSPFTCGEINTLHGFLLLEAFNYAINQVNAKKGQFSNILKGTTLGGVGLDACESPVRGGYLVSNVNNGLTVLEKDGRTIPASKIDAYIGSYDSPSSIYLARILTDLELPQISYGASSTELNDQRVNPFFYRTVPSDDNLVKALLDFQDKMNIRYIQVVYQDNSYGKYAMEELKKMAEDYNICVAQYVEHPDPGVANRETANGVVAQLIEKPEANVVVTFLGTNYVNFLLKAVGRSERAHNKLRFFGSDTWADNMDAIIGATDSAVDSITTKLDSDDVDEFELYINSKTLANSVENPWFEEYYQKIQNCYTSKANQGSYQRLCSGSVSDTINSQAYQQDPGVVYVINAVYAAAFALDKTLRDKCGNDYTAVCQAYKTSEDRRLGILDNLASVNFTDPVGHEFHFRNRQGIANYRYSSINRGVLGGVTHNQIGTYFTDSGTAIISQSYKTVWNSGCDREDACAECPAIRNQGKRFMFAPEMAARKRPTVVAFFDIHKQGVDPYRCGELNLPGFYNFLAFYYGVTKLFRDTLQGTTPSENIRILAIDTCSNSMRVDQDLYGLLQGTGLCNSEFTDDYDVFMDNIGSVLVVGEENTMAAARVLEPNGITYVSSDAMSTLLDNKMHLARTIAPISAQMQALAALLKTVGWDYVDLVSENSIYGHYPSQRFQMFAEDNRICRGSTITVEESDTNAVLVEKLSQLSGFRGSKAVILLGSKSFIRRIIEIANDQDIVESYIWVICSEWEVTTDFLESLISSRAVKLQAISMKRLTDEVSSFDQWLAGNQMVADGERNELQVPREWWEEFYQTVADCRLLTAVKPLNPGKSLCGGQGIPVSNIHQDPRVINTLAATYAIMDSLRKYMTDIPDSDKVPSMDNLEARKAIREKVLSVNWQMQSTQDLDLKNNRDLILSFTEWRWWDSGYIITIWTVQRDSKGVVSTTSDQLWKGTLTPNDRQVEEMKALLNATSVCTEKDGNCGCHFMQGPMASKMSSPDFEPTEPRNYYYYDNEDSKQYDWPIWAIAVAVLTVLGLAVAVILFLILLFAYPKKGGTSVLGYMMILGIIAIYAINFAFFIHATDATCGARRFLMGVFYMIALAPLLIKSVDNWRFGHVHYAERRYSGISSSFVLFLSAVAIVLIQCIIPIIWLILVHPTYSVWPVGDGRHDLHWCDPPDEYDLGLVLSFVFVIFIVFITGILSAMAYDCETNNYESRWILFGCIATCGCFLVWMVVTTNASPTYRDPTVAIANFVNATLLLIIIPIRKTILMCRARQEEDEKKDAMEVINNETPYDVYSSSYANPTFELSDYADQYGQPSDY